MTQHPESAPVAESFAAHVRAFHSTLPWEEQSLLEQVFTLAEQAAGEAGDAEGYLKTTGPRNPFPRPVPAVSAVFELKLFADAAGSKKI